MSGVPSYPYSLVSYSPYSSYSSPFLQLHHQYTIPTGQARGASGTAAPPAATQHINGQLALLNGGGGSANGAAGALSPPSVYAAAAAGGLLARGSPAVNGSMMAAAANGLTRSAHNGYHHANNNNNGGGNSLSLTSSSLSSAATGGKPLRNGVGGDSANNNTISNSNSSSPSENGKVETTNGLTLQEQEEYLQELIKERDSIEKSTISTLSKSHILRLLNKEISRLQGSGIYYGDDIKFIDVYREKCIRVTVRVLVPVREHPKFNFVGKLLGPKGNSLKRLQEETLTKMAVLGRGSMRDRDKEEELRLSGDPKYSHLQEELHVEITAFAPPAEAYARLAFALTEVRKYITPDSNDDIRQQQMRELELLSSGLAGAAGDHTVASTQQQQQAAIAALAAAAAASQQPLLMTSPSLQIVPPSSMALHQSQNGGPYSSGGNGTTNSGIPSLLPTPPLESCAATSPTTITGLPTKYDRQQSPAAASVDKEAELSHQNGGGGPLKGANNGRNRSINNNKFAPY